MAEMFKLNYQVAYDCLINFCKLRGLDKKKLEYKTHKHHIIPRCIGGLDIDDNYVLLTLQEHRNAHHLLTLIYPDDNKLKYAVSLMSGKKSSGHLGCKHSEETKAKISYNSRNISMETRKKIGDANRNRIVTNETRKKLSNVQKGHRNYSKPNHSEETKLKMSLASKGKPKALSAVAKLFKPITIDNITYINRIEAAKGLNISYSALASRINRGIYA